jgi:hypothetical protein
MAPPLTPSLRQPESDLRGMVDLICHHLRLGSRDTAGYVRDIRVRWVTSLAAPILFQAEFSPQPLVAQSRTL